MTTNGTLWQGATDLASDPQHRNSPRDLEQPLLTPETPRSPSSIPPFAPNLQSFDAQSHRTCWSWLAFSWIAPVLNFGSTLPQLQQRHLPPVPASSTPDHCGDALWAAWNNEVRKAANRRRQPSLFRALFRTFGASYLAIGVLKFLSDALNFAGPVLLNGLLRYLDAPVATEPRDGGGEFPAAVFFGINGILELGKHHKKDHSGAEPDIPTTGDINLNYGSHLFGAACAILLALSLFIKVSFKPLSHFKAYMSLFKQLLKRPK